MKIQLEVIEGSVVVSSDTEASVGEALVLVNLAELYLLGLARENLAELEERVPVAPPEEERLDLTINPDRTL